MSIGGGVDNLQEALDDVVKDRIRSLPAVGRSHPPYQVWGRIPDLPCLCWDSPRSVRAWAAHIPRDILQGGQSKFPAWDHIPRDYIVMDRHNALVQSVTPTWPSQHARRHAITYRLARDAPLEKRLLRNHLSSTGNPSSADIGLSSGIYA